MNNMIKNRIAGIFADLFGEDNLEKVMESENLVEDFGFDSIQFVELVTLIEQEYSIVVPDELLTVELFRSVDRVVEIINTLSLA